MWMGILYSHRHKMDSEFHATPAFPLAILILSWNQFTSSHTANAAQSVGLNTSLEKHDCITYNAFLYPAIQSQI